MTDTELLDVAARLLRKLSPYVSGCGNADREPVAALLAAYDARQAEQSEPYEAQDGKWYRPAGKPLCSTCGGSGVYRGPHALVKQKLPCPDCSDRGSKSVGVLT